VLVTPVPGTRRGDLREELRSALKEVCDLRDGIRAGLRDGTRPASARRHDYLEWVNGTVRRLERQISAADVDRLVRTRGYELLLSGLGGFTTLPADQDAVRGLIFAELDARCAAFDVALNALESQIQRWSMRAEFVVLDTNVYIHHPQKLEELDVAALIGNPCEAVHVLVPILVVDELDGLKRTKERGRASCALAVLDRAFKRSTGPEPLPRDGPAAACSGELTIEIVFDPPGHVRLPINDDEIVDRAVAIQPLAARKVTLVTYDTGMSLRARAAGLSEIKLSQQRGEERQ
jgi:rRNA-processing protein FCF1